MLDRLRNRMRERRDRHRIYRATEHLTAHLLRDIGLEGHGHREDRRFPTDWRA